MDDFDRQAEGLLSALDTTYDVGDDARTIANALRAAHDAGYAVGLDRAASYVEGTHRDDSWHDAYHDDPLALAEDLRDLPSPPPAAVKETTGEAPRQDVYEDVTENGQWMNKSQLHAPSPRPATANMTDLVAERHNVSVLNEQLTDAESRAAELRAEVEALRALVERFRRYQRDKEAILARADAEEMEGLTVDWLRGNALAWQHAAYQLEAALDAVRKSATTGEKGDE